MRRRWRAFVCFCRGHDWLPVVDNRRACARCGVVCNDETLRAFEDVIGKPL